jgi:hypothetical protein
MTYKIVPWSISLDLNSFYSTAFDKGYINNASQEQLVDCFRNEREWQVWILYYNNTAVGSVAAHSFDEMGSNSYRIAARTCLFTDHIPYSGLRTIRQWAKFQHPVGQYLIKQCINWAPEDANLYTTTVTENAFGSQDIFHTVASKILSKDGTFTKSCDMVYRNTQQSIWKIDRCKMLDLIGPGR